MPRIATSTGVRFPLVAACALALAATTPAAAATGPARLDRAERAVIAKINHKRAASGPAGPAAAGTPTAGRSHMGPLRPSRGARRLLPSRSARSLLPSRGDRSLRPEPWLLAPAVAAAIAAVYLAAAPITPDLAAQT